MTDESKPQPADEDEAIAATEKALRDECVRYTNEVLRLATSLISHGPKAASRGLHLTEGVAALQAEMLRLLGMAKKKRRPRRVGPYSMQYSAGYDDDEPDESMTGDAIGETFGNHALKQMIAMAKPLIQQGGIPGIISNAKANQKGAEIESLTKALAEATEKNLPQEVREGIAAKLKIALLPDTMAPAVPELLAGPDEPLQPVDVELVGQPLFVCGAEEGV